MNDLRYALRALTKAPLFTTVAVVTLALGIGANTAIFSVVNAVLLRPLPYPEPDGLVRVFAEFKGERWTTSPPDFVDWRTQQRSFEDLTGYWSRTFTITGEGAPERLSGASVSAAFFSVFRSPPQLGRVFTVEDEARGDHLVVVLSDRLWRRRFGADSSILGRIVRLSDEPYTVIGIAPAGFDYPTNAELWTPVAFSERDLTTQRGAHYISVVGRLRGDQSVQRAADEIGRIAEGLEQAYPETNTGWSATAISLREQVVGDVRLALVVLLSAVGLVLLIACANVANLSLTRAVARQREIAVRTALGAGRWRIVRGVLAESLVLAGAGGALGVLLAVWGTGLLASVEAVRIPRLGEASMDVPVLGFSLLLSVFTGVAFGALPAWHASRADVGTRLKEGGRGAAGDRTGGRLRSGLVIAEMALAVMLAAGAGLLMKSFLKLQRVDPGLDPRGVLAFNVSLPEAKYAQPEDAEMFFADLLQRVEGMPGVQAAGAVFGLPFSGFRYSMSVFSVDGVQPASPEVEQSVQVRVVTPDYFRVMGIPVMRGRHPSATDRAGEPSVALVNRSAAELLWPGRDPLGHHVEIGTGFGLGRGRAGGEVVGVVPDFKHQGLDADARAEIYLIHRQFPIDFMSVVVKSEGDALALMAPIQRAVQAIDPDVPAYAVSTMDQLVARSIAQPRFYTLILAVFAASALVLAALGIYGVTAYAVAQRTQELGVRVALGARREDIIRLVVGRGVWLALGGLALGLAGALATSRFVGDLLYQVPPTDSTTYALVGALLVLVAIASCYLPARRASRVDPMEALRYE